MKKLLLILLCLLFALPALAEEFSLPIDFSGGYKPDPANYTKDSYEDASLSVKMEKRDIDGVRYDIAWIKVASPTQLRTAIAGKPNQIVADKPGRMARKVNAVVAINGDFYVQRKDGLIYRQGEAFRQIINPEKDILVIDDLGDLHVFLGGENQTAELLAFMQSGRTIINAFTFGPAIVKDGQALPMPATYQTRFDSAVRAPRTVIAQIGPLEYVFVEAEGRVKHSKGVTTDQMGEFMVTLGVQTAYCMDGGNSSIMLFGGKYYDANYAASEREQSDIIYVCSAVPTEE
ncbi:MAG: phosphodiester glycosidase family protein [Clostridiales bacterium]|nr:phosphodiester glycosidase family protein [Clostridiales bacterium]